MDNFIIIAVVAVIVAAAGIYVYKAKKKGAKCIGCPAGGCCSGCAMQDAPCTCGDKGGK